MAPDAVTMHEHRSQERFERRSTSERTPVNIGSDWSEDHLERQSRSIGSGVTIGSIAADRRRRLRFSAKRTASPDVLPAAPLLQAPELWPELAASVGPEELAWVEPVLGDRSAEDGRQSAPERWNPRTAMVPERAPVGDLGEGEHLFDPPVAVRGDDEDRPRKIRGGALGQAQDEVVMELALHPVGDELVAAVPRDQVFEERSEHQLAGQAKDRFVHGLNLRDQPLACQSPERMTRPRPGNPPLERSRRRHPFAADSAIVRLSG
jgi:hypothetical protein